MDFSSEKNQSTNEFGAKKQYKTIKEYLDALVYPSLQEGIIQLINYIKTTDQLEERLTKQFKTRFYQINNDYHKKQKELLKLERGDDYSETDYDYYLRDKNDVNESKSENEENENDLDFDELNDEELENIKQQLETDDLEKFFNPISFLSETLRKINKRNKEKKEESKHTENEFLQDENIEEIEKNEDSEHS